MSSSRKNLKNVSLSFELFPKKSSLVLCNSLSRESCFLEQLLFMMFLDQSGQYLCATNISCNTWHLVYTQNSSQWLLVTQFIENDFIAVNLNLFFFSFLFIFYFYFLVSWIQFITNGILRVHSIGPWIWTHRLLISFLY